MEATIEFYGCMLRGTVRQKGRAAFETVGGDHWYAGEFDVGKPNGYGVYVSSGTTRSGRWADGKSDGYIVDRCADGSSYWLYDRGIPVHWAREDEGGAFTFDGDRCDAADPPFADLREAALEAEVRLAPGRRIALDAPAPTATTPCLVCTRRRAPRQSSPI